MMKTLSKKFYRVFLFFADYRFMSKIAKSKKAKTIFSSRLVKVVKLFLDNLVDWNPCNEAKNPFI